MFNLSGSWFLASSKSKASYIPPNPQIHDVKLNPHSNPHSFHNHIVIDHHHHHPQIWIPESNHQIIIRTCGIIKSSSIFTIIIFTIPKLSNEIPKLCPQNSPKIPNFGFKRRKNPISRPRPPRPVPYLRIEVISPSKRLLWLPRNYAFLYIYMNMYS